LASFLHNLFKKLLTSKTVTTVDAETGETQVTKQVQWTEPAKISAHMKLAAAEDVGDSNDKLEDAHDSSVDMVEFESEEQKAQKAAMDKRAFKMEMHKLLDRQMSAQANVVPMRSARKLPEDTTIPLSKSDLERSSSEEAEEADAEASGAVEEEADAVGEEEKDDQDLDFLNDFSAMQQADFDEYAYALEGQEFEQRNKELSKVKVKIVDKNDGVRVKHKRKKRKKSVIRRSSVRDKVSALSCLCL
jgi:hypothetical protein